MEAKRKGHIYLESRKRQLIFLGHTMRKEGLKNLKLTGYVDVKNDRGKQRINHLTNLCKWMTGHGLRAITKRNFIKSNKGLEVVESHNHTRPKRTWHITSSSYIDRNIKTVYFILFT